MLFLLGHGDDTVVFSAHQNVEVLSGEICGVAGVIRVHMSDENVRVFRAQVERRHPLVERGDAVGMIKARVDKEVPAAVFSLYHIAVEPLQRAVREDYGESP